MAAAAEFVSRTLVIVGSCWMGTIANIMVSGIATETGGRAILVSGGWLVIPFKEALRRARKVLVVAMGILAAKLLEVLAGLV